MLRKFRFYDRYGVEEYYVYDPDRGELDGWIRRGGELVEIEKTQGWVSPRLGVRFELADGELRIYRPDGEPFASFVQVMAQREQARQEAAQATARAEQERQRAESAEARAERLAAQLRALGVEPENE